MSDNAFYLRQTRNILALFLLFFCAAFYACDRSEARQKALHQQLAAQPPIQTCITHSPLDRITVTR